MIPKCIIIGNLIEELSHHSSSTEAVASAASADARSHSKGDGTKLFAESPSVSDKEESMGDIKGEAHFLLPVLDSSSLSYHIEA